jgi:Ser/Thr protein kinase RdoA (MazF antagonist)
MNENLLRAYGFDPQLCIIKQFGTGLINHTSLVTDTTSGKRYIFQRVNDAIFKRPEDIAFNIRTVDDYLKAHCPGYLFESPVFTQDGRDLIQTEEGFFRLFRFVENSHSIDVVEKPFQAFEAARQFGLLTANLDGFDASALKITLPDFHNLPLRFQQFESAVANGNPERIQKAQKEIEFLFENQDIARQAVRLQQLPVRVIHHDTKISNVLLDEQDKGLCVIDLDTLMPGRFVSDLGDMMRTYLSPANEEEADVAKVTVRLDFFEAILNGYIGAMKNIFTSEEKEFVVYSGQFMIYMQALRFIADHLNNDTYYGARYVGHNFVRGVNQIALLSAYQAKIADMQLLADRLLK